MPIDLPPKSGGDGMARAGVVLDRILNWTAVVVCIGLCGWAAAHLFGAEVANLTDYFGAAL